MLNLREFYSTITKPADTSRGVVILLQDKTIIFNEFNNVMYEINRVYLEEGFSQLSFYITNIKQIITDVDSQLLKGQDKPDIIIPLQNLLSINIGNNIFPLIDKRNWFNTYNFSVHKESFNQEIRDMINASKSNGGSYRYIIQNEHGSFFMIIYKGLINMAKNNIVNVEILLNHAEPAFFIAKFTTYKKKEDLCITQYIPFLRI